MTKRDIVTIFALGAAPAVVAWIGHSLRLGGPLLAIAVALVGTCCVAAGVHIGWRT